MNTLSELAASEIIVRLRRLLQAEEYAAGLNPAHWEALRYFSRCNRFSNRPAALVAFLGSTKGTVSQTLAALERKGLLRKVPAGAARSFAVELTEAGRAAVARDPARHFDRMVEAGAEPLRHALARLLAELQRSRGSKSFGLCRTCRFFGEDNDNRREYRCRLLDLPLSEDDGNRICVEHEWPAGGELPAAAG